MTNIYDEFNPFVSKVCTKIDRSLRKTVSQSVIDKVVELVYCDIIQDHRFVIQESITGDEDD